MNRPEWKGPYINEKKINKLENLKKNYNLTMPRNTKILPNFLGLNIKVHNGKKYINFTITQEMIGHKLGEFSITRAEFSFKKKKSKK